MRLTAQSTFQGESCPGQRCGPNLYGIRAAQIRPTLGQFWPRSTEFVTALWRNRPTNRCQTSTKSGPMPAEIMRCEPSHDHVCLDVGRCFHRCRQSNGNMCCPESTIRCPMLAHV